MVILKTSTPISERTHLTIHMFEVYYVRLFNDSDVVISFKAEW